MYDLCLHMIYDLIDYVGKKLDEMSTKRSLREGTGFKRNLNDEFFLVNVHDEGSDFFEVMKYMLNRPSSVKYMRTFKDETDVIGNELQSFAYYDELYINDGIPHDYCGAGIDVGINYVVFVCRSVR